MKIFFSSFFALVIVVPSFASAQEVKMETKTYQVMPTFTAFASRSKEAGNPDEQALLKKNLIRSGIKFPKGARASFDAKTLQFTITNSPDEFEFVEMLLIKLKKQSEATVHVLYEFIEVDHDEFSDWLFDHVMENDATELRNEVQKWIKAGRAEIIEAVVVAGLSGRRAKIESGDEFIYPTEYGPAAIPNKADLKDGAQAIVTGVTPHAFATRKLGVTLEVDPVVGADGRVVDLNLAPEIVRLEKIDKWPAQSTDPKFQTEMPTFYTMKITTQITGISGHYQFMGTTRPLKSADPKRTNPIVLNFVRGDVSFTGEWSEDTGN